MTTLTLDLETARNLAVAALAGLAVGIEREWSGHASGPSARFAGARTFLLLGILGGIAGWLTGGGLVGLGAVIIAGAAVLSGAAYVMAARRSPADIEGTTEVAALAVLALGAVARSSCVRRTVPSESTDPPIEMVLPWSIIEAVRTCSAALRNACSWASSSLVN